MKGIPILILTVFLVFGFSGCGGGAAGTAETDDGSEAAESSDPGPDSGAAAEVRVNYEEDAFELMGTDYQSFLAKLSDGMVAEFLDGESAGAHEADYHYILNNGVEVSIAGDTVISVHVSYAMEADYPVPVIKGIGGEDTYAEAVTALGTPYYEGSELAGEDETEYYAAVFYAGQYRYLKVYFDKETGYAAFISCFYGEAPVYEEAGRIKAGDSLEDLKAAYDKLYYATAYYDPAQGEPEYNRIYYTPMEDRDDGTECLVFYLMDKKVVKITTEIRDNPGWRDYEDLFGRKDVFKENNMTGRSGNIVYFYDDASGNEQVLLKVENCATEEIDVDDDGITEIIAYKAGPVKAIDIFDYDAAAQTVLRLDVCEALGAGWSEYMGNAANVKEEYARCVAAGFSEESGADRIETYAVKDNVLTYIGPLGQEMFQ